MNLPKVLCLHGFGQNKTIMIKKTKEIREKLNNKVELVYLSAPFQLLDEHPFAINFNDYIIANGLEDQAKNFEPLLSWFPSFDNKVIDYMPVIPYISKVLKEEGPFVGIIGFSQGAALTSYLTKLLEINHPYLQSANHPSLKFSIMYSGFILHVKEIEKLFELKNNTPSLHLFSNIDKVVKYDSSIENVNCYNNSIAVEHPLGHTIPSTADYNNIVIQFIQSKLNINTQLQSNL